MVIATERFRERAQRARLIRRRAQGPEEMAIRAQQVGEDERIAGITLAAGGGVARAAGLEGVRGDGHHLEAGGDERVDEQAGGAFEGNAQGAAGVETAQAAEELGEALGRVRHGALPVDAGGLVDHADRVDLTRPVDPDEEWHCVVSRDGETLQGERSGRSLTDWRSGLLGHVARHPVAGLGLSRFHSGERVSSWPSSGKRRGLSPNLSGSIPPQDARFRGSGPSNTIAHWLQDRRSSTEPYLDLPSNDALSHLSRRVVQ